MMNEVKEAVREFILRNFPDHPIGLYDTWTIDEVLNKNYGESDLQVKESIKNIIWRFE